MSKKLHNGLVLSTLATAIMMASSASADLIISEYVEGSSFNKALELYNTGDAAVDLSNYQLVKFTNDTDSLTTLALTGSLDAGRVYVVAHSSASEEILALADKQDGVTNFNGNDPIQLQMTDGTVVDAMGVVGSSAYFAQDVTLSRNIGVITGTATYDASQWTIGDQDYIDGLGFSPDGVSEPEPILPDPDFGQCGDDSDRISAIQGAGSSSPVVGEIMTIQGVVSAIKPDTYYVQQTTTGDDIVGASLGIQIYDPANTPAAGDEVYLRGKVDEFFGMTQLSDIEANFALCDTGISVAHTLVELSEDTDLETSLEPFEGMLVSFDTGSDLYVSNSYYLNRYGEMTLSVGGNNIKPTNLYTAGSDEAIALQTKNDNNQIDVADASSTSNLGEISFFEDLSYENTVRTGSRISALEGVLFYSYGNYNVLTTGQVELDTNVAQREEYPETRAAGTLRAASFNVLNYFNGLLLADGAVDWTASDLGGARGASNAAEFAVQRSKIISAISRMEPDVLGIMEMENDGWGEDSAIQDLVNGLNESSEKPADSSFSFVSTTDKYVGTDVIKVSLVYNETAVEPVGDAIVLTAYPFDETTAKHRPPVIQTFKDIALGNEFTVVVNHFKSKGSVCDALGDVDAGDGQGNCNRLRVAASETLGEYLQANFADQDVLILGDLNAYGKEDPVLVLTGDDTGRTIETIVRSDDGVYSTETTDFRLGYSELVQAINGEAPISYVYDGEAGALDHAIASASLLAKVDSVMEWSINGFELPHHDYNREYKTTTDDSGYTWYERMVRSETPFRSSDHDPVIVDFSFDAVVTPADPAEEDEGGSFGFPMLALGLLSLLGLRRRKKH